MNLIVILNIFNPFNNNLLEFIINLINVYSFSLI